MAYKITKIGRNATVKIDTTLLNNLMLGVGKKLITRVGILGSGANRVTQQPGETHSAYKKQASKYLKTGLGADAQTNADIGLAHEKGIKSKNLPRRSWLEEPLNDHMSEHFQKLGKKAIESILNANYELAYLELGVVAENIIQRGFATGGYGKWKPLKPSTIKGKGSDSILIATAQLRRSVTSEVVSK